MPKTDPDGLDPRLKWQLRSALDRIEPLNSSPRYLQGQPAVRGRGIAPGIFAAGVAGLLVLTLLAAASARSIDLQHRIVNTIQSATDPTPTPLPEPSPSPSPTPQVAVQAPPSGSPAKSHPTESPEPSDRPDSGETRTSPWATPSPWGQHGSYGSPSPTPGDH
ncbi:MAG TPA: hypothetical protein VEU76_03600 [Candidatus Udaeobacter sp.]|nr:hypothetical protein [Candidatus Udaeobacter sp.]